MPGLDGIEVLSRIQDRYESVLVIMITGFSTVDTAIKAMKKGAYDFISKPFSPGRLRIVIKRAMEKLGLTRQSIALKLERQKNLADLATEQSLSDFNGKPRIISVVPSLDTPVCAQQTKRFNEEAAKLPGVEFITISADLPTAQSRFCGAEKIDTDRVKVLSDHQLWFT